MRAHPLRRGSTPRWLAILAMACGGSDGPAEPATSPPPPPAAVLDYSGIAGEWTGTVTELRTANVYTTEISILPQGLKGQKVGTITYHTTLWRCEGNLVADAISDQKYALVEVIQSGPCVPTVAIELTPVAHGDSLQYVALNIQNRVPCCNARLGRP